MHDAVVAAPGPLLQTYLQNAPLVQGHLVESEPIREAAVGATRVRCWLGGTGTPAVVDGRYGPSTVLAIGSDVIMVDTGNGCVYQLFRLGWTPEDVTKVFITHNHLDHNVDLAFLVLAPWIHGTREHPPTVYGPPGTLEYVNRILAAHDYDVRARLPHGYDPSKLQVPVVEVHDGLELKFGHWSATAVKVDHVPVEDAYGYAFRTGDHSIVVSGDTRPCDRLIDAASDADVLIHEVLFPGFGIPDYHTTVEEVGQVAAAANVTKLVLTHLIPGHLPDKAWLDVVRRHFDGEVVVGKDLLQVCDFN